MLYFSNKENDELADNVTMIDNRVDGLRHCTTELVVIIFSFEGIVRAVDAEAGLVYLTTGVPPKQLMEVNAILRGQINLPQAIYTEQVSLVCQLLSSLPLIQSS